MMDFYECCLYQVVTAEKHRVNLPPLKFKGNAVRVANYLRQWGYRCKIRSVFGFCYWVEVILE